MADSSKVSKPEATGKEVEEAQKKLARLELLFEDIQKGRQSKELLEECPELTTAVAEVEKIQYQIGIMKRHIEETTGKPSGPSAAKQQNGAPAKPKEVKPTVKYVEILNYGDSIIERLTSTFGETVKKLFPDIGVDVSLSLRETTHLKFGDYQFDCNLVSKKLADKAGTKTNPLATAKQIVEALPSLDLVDKFQQVNAFVNVFLNRKLVGQKIASVYKNGISLPELKKKRVVIDFSSPNIAKQMHVGHLRSTIIGESFARLLEYAGFDVLRLNHIGDWGTQFGMLIAHLQDKFPNYATETPPIGDLQTFYKASKIQFDEDEVFKKRAYQCVVKLQNFDPEITQAWKLICDVSRADYTQLYKRLDVTLVERGESFYQTRMVEIIKMMDEKKLLVEDKGAKLCWPTGATIPLIMVKSDGGFTYDTSDMATIKNRLFEEKADWLLYVVDAGQAEHFKLIFSATRDLGWYKPEEKRVEHVQFGVVLGEDGKKFKTRSGDTIRLIDLLNEGVQRSENKLREKQRDQVMTAEQFAAAREAVAYGCIKFADLSQTRTNDYMFSFTQMLNDQGKTAVYLLYAYARIRSIARNANIDRERLLKYMDEEVTDLTLPFDQDAELKLAKQLLRFSDVILLVLETLHLHKLCDYVYHLATVFSDFYKTCYVMNTNKETGEVKINYHRMILCEVTAETMKKCFELLGIRPLDIM